MGAMGLIREFYGVPARTGWRQGNERKRQAGGDH